MEKQYRKSGGDLYLRVTFSFKKFRVFRFRTFWLKVCWNRNNQNWKFSTKSRYEDAYNGWELQCKQYESDDGPSEMFTFDLVSHDIQDTFHIIRKIFQSE